MWYWLFKYIFMGPLLSLLGRPKVEGLEYVPHSGPMILASNHLAVADSFYLPLVVTRRITFLAKAEYFTGTGLKGRFQRWFYTAAGQVPIDRTDADSAQSALITAARVVGEGKLLGMHPVHRTRGDRRGDVRADAAGRPGVRRPLCRRRQRTQGRQARDRGQAAGADAGSGRRLTDRSADRAETVPATAITAIAHHTYEPPASWRHSDAEVSWCSGISGIGVHTINAIPAAATRPSATCR